MSYTNVSHSITRPLEIGVRENWVDSRTTNCVKRHVFARAAYLILTPASFIARAIDTIAGLGAVVGTILSPIFSEGNREIYQITREHLESSKKLLVDPYMNFLKTINPKTGVSQVSIEADGFISDLVIEPLRDIARECYRSHNCLKRHVASRLTYVLLALACLVTRAVDGLIALPVAVCSILTGGTIQSLNDLAYRSLQATGIINDLAYCLIKFVNPWTSR